MQRPESSGRFRTDVEERALRPTVTPNGNPDLPPSSVGEDVDEPGDPSGVEIVGDTAQWRSTHITPSPWSGWPANWATPLWGAGGGRLDELTDTAWAGLDLNASILSTMPPYVMRGAQMLEDAPTWLGNPDPDLYTSWEEFAKQLFWSYQLGEAFVIPTAYSATGWPARFHVVEPWLVNVEMLGGRRRYTIGTLNVTDEILHVRYKSTTDSARGTGPLDAGRSRVIAAAVLARYMSTLVEGGGVPYYVLTHPQALTAAQADDLLHGWFESRMNHLGMPAIASGGLQVQPLSMSPKDMALLDLSQFNESRLSVLLGVPPFLLGLPSGGDSMTYSNVSALFDYHWRAGLRPKASPTMAALSGWALPRGQRIELNRDEYVRPGFGERVTAWSTLHGIQDETGRAIDAADIRAAERLTGSTQAPATLTGGI